MFVLIDVLLDSITTKLTKTAMNAVITASNVPPPLLATSVKPELRKSLAITLVTSNADLAPTALRTTVLNGFKPPTAENATTHAQNASGQDLRTASNALLDFTLSLTTSMTCSRRVLTMTSSPLPNRREDASMSAELGQAPSMESATSALRTVLHVLRESVLTGTAMNGGLEEIKDSVCLAVLMMFLTALSVKKVIAKDVWLGSSGMMLKWTVYQTVLQDSFETKQTDINAMFVQIVAASVTTRLETVYSVMKKLLLETTTQWLLLLKIVQKFLVQRIVSSVVMSLDQLT